MTLRKFLVGLPAWFRLRYGRWLLIVPVLGAVMAHILPVADALGCGNPHACKTLMEWLHPTLLIIGSVLGLAGWMAFRDLTFVFLAGLFALFFARELGGQGTSVFLYAGLAVLVV